MSKPACQLTLDDNGSFCQGNFCVNNLGAYHDDKKSQNAAEQQKHGL